MRAAVKAGLRSVLPLARSLPRGHRLLRGSSGTDARCQATSLSARLYFFLYRITVSLVLIPIFVGFVIEKFAAVFSKVCRRRAHVTASLELGWVAHRRRWH